jgi:glycerophosphoryl diester phosphodiesterase
MTRKPLVLCHRGLHHDVPENTIESFELAASLSGVTGIETDLRLSAHGEVILFHDPTTSDGQAIDQLSRDTIQRAVGYPIPTLEEALNQCPNLLWNLEFKVEDAVTPTLDILKTFPNPEHILLSSFIHGVIEDCATTAPYACGLLWNQVPDDLEKMAERWQSLRSIQTMIWRDDLIDETLVKTMAAHGFHTLVYGLPTEAAHQRCLDAGVDGMITDNPEWVT